MTRKTRNRYFITSLISVFVMAVTILFSNGKFNFSTLGVRGTSSEPIEGSITWTAQNSEKTRYGSNRWSYLRYTQGGTPIYLYAYGTQNASDEVMYSSYKHAYSTSYGLFINSTNTNSPNYFKFQSITSVSVEAKISDPSLDTGGGFSIYPGGIITDSPVVSQTVNSTLTTYTFTSQVAGARYLAILPTLTNKVIDIYSLTISYTCYNGGKPGEKELLSISLSNVKNTYDVGETFVKPTVTAHYSDSTTNDVTSSAKFTGYDTSTLGLQAVIVSYKEDGITATTSYNITVNKITLSGTYNYVSRQGSGGSHHLSWNEPDHYMTISFEGDLCTWFSTQIIEGITYRCYIFLDYVAVKDGSNIKLTMVRNATNGYDFYQGDSKEPYDDGSAKYNWFADGSYDRPTRKALTASDSGNESGIITTTSTDRDTLTIDVYQYGGGTPYPKWDTFTFKRSL